MIPIIVYKTDGRVIPMSIPSQDAWKTYQALVGGPFKALPITKGMLVLNEEGWLLELPYNKSYPQFVGDVVFVKTEDFK